MAMSKDPLLVPQKDLATFVAGIGPGVQRAFELPSNRQLFCQKYQPIAGASLEKYGITDTSAHGAKVRDMRGTELDAVKLVVNKTDVILTTLSFDWVRTGSKFRFDGAQFAIFFGSSSSGVLNDDARQLFRLEWQGRRDDGSFEAAVAGHPHWQVDAIPTPAVTVPEAAAPVDLADLMQKTGPARKTWLTRIHMPSAANDWAVGTGWSGDPNECDAHASSPDSLESLSTWVFSASRYIKHQINAAVAQ